MMRAVETELARAFKGLQKAEKAPLYYLGYQVRDVRTLDVTAYVGALTGEAEHHYRSVDVDVRVGDRKLDNTHQIKGKESWSEGQGQQHFTELSVDDDEAGLRTDLWLRTEDAYKDAVQRYTKVATNKAVTAEEEDKSDDFSLEPPATGFALVAAPVFDLEPWRGRLRRLSAAIKAYPFVFDSGVRLSLRTENRWTLTSEGTRVADGNRFVRLSYSLSSRTEDGMDLERTKSYDGDSVGDLPSEDLMLSDLRRAADELKALRGAPLVEPYTGPAIIRARATGVYFHEILGHRLEGHRQRMEDEGQTFTKMLGKEVVAPFLSVVDDPLRERFGRTFLRGSYRYDDEGVPARRVSLIENGVLKTFLMSRLPVKGFDHSNGHGRRSPGFGVIPRMGNLIVTAAEKVPYPRLREKLIEEIRRQKKPYGLVFEDISGGFTGTQRQGPQSFKVMPLLVYRVYPDGRPDEVVRGVDIVGTPLTSFSKIIAAADDDDVFNGTCGAESGWVPVSAVAPSVLVSEIEVEKKAKSSEKPPVLPPPYAGGGQP
jgi:predicted Zn-dependent protease